MKNFALLALTFFIAHPALAGGEMLQSRESGGAKSVLCPGKKPQLLDFERARREWKFKIVPASGGDEWEKAAQIIKRIKKYDRSRYFDFEYTLRQFKKEMDLVYDTDFRMLDDSNELGLPAGCHPEILVNQKMNRFPEEKRYRVNGPVWDAMNADHRAGAIVHEIFYGEAMERGQENSNSSAYLNALINSEEFGRMEEYDYYERMSLAKFSIKQTFEGLHVPDEMGNRGGVFFENLWPGVLEDFSFSADELVAMGGEVVAGGTTARGSRYAFPYKDSWIEGDLYLPPLARVLFHSETREVFVIMAVEFYRETQLEARRIAKRNEESAEFEGNLSIHGVKVQIDGYEITLKKGALRDFRLAGTEKVEMKTAPEKTVTLYPNAKVRLNAEGFVTDYCLENPEGDYKCYGPDWGPRRTRPNPAD